MLSPVSFWQRRIHGHAPKASAKSRNPPHDFIMIDLHTHSISQIEFQ